MEIKHLKSFLTIVEEGQITSAAKRLNIAQPPLSQQMKLLEDELGVRLFERGPRHIELTDAGKLLKERAEQILQLSASTVNEIKDLRSGLKGTLSIGTVSSSGALFMNHNFSSFVKDFPAVKFEIHEGNTFKILELLDKGIIEIGIVRTPFNMAKYTCKFLDSEPMIAVTPRRFSGDLKNSSVTIETLRNKPLIIYRRFEQLIYEVCREAGFEPDIICKNDDARTTLMWANFGMGIGIMPKSAFSLVDNSNLYYQELDNSKLETRIAAIWREDRYFSSLAEKFIEYFGK